MHLYTRLSQLIAKGIIGSYIIWQRHIGAALKPPTSIVSNCDVCGGLMFNAQHYMHMNDAYFALSTIWFPYEMKKIFDWILHELQYLDREHSHHFTLDLDQLDRIFEYRFIPATSVELEYMFDTLCFLWLHHGSPPYLIHLLGKLVDRLSDERMNPPHSTTTCTL